MQRIAWIACALVSVGCTFDTRGAPAASDGGVQETDADPGETVECERGADYGS